MTAYFHSEDASIRAPVRDCYDLVLAVRRYAEWWPGTCVAAGPEGVLHVGSRCTLQTAAWTGIVEVVALQPHRRIDLEFVSGDLLGPLRWELAEQSAGNDARVRVAWRGVHPNSAQIEALLRADDGVRRHCAEPLREALARMRRVLEAPGADLSGGDLFATLHSQRAVRRFRHDDIPEAVLAEILTAATRAPSARNTQPWVFVAVRNAERKAEIRSHYLSAWRQAQAYTTRVDADADIKDRADYAAMMRGVDALAEHLDEAPVLVLCGLDTRQLGPMADANGNILSPQSAYASIFPAVQNLMLAARGLGVGSTLTTVFSALEGELRRVVGLPDQIHIAALIPLGYPHRSFRVTARKPLNAVAHLDRWGNPFPG